MASLGAWADTTVSAALTKKCFVQSSRPRSVVRANGAARRQSRSSRTWPSKPSSRIGRGRIDVRATPNYPGLEREPLSNPLNLLYFCLTLRLIRFDLGFCARNSNLRAVLYCFNSRRRRVSRFAARL